MRTWKVSLSLRAGIVAALFPLIFTAQAQQVTSSLNLLEIAHIVDAGGWRTSIQLVNLDQVTVKYSIQFWDDHGAPLKLPFKPSGLAETLAGSVGIGGSAFIETAGSPVAAVRQGWAHVISSGRIGVLAIFRQIAPLGVTYQDSEGTVTGAQSGDRIFLPFDDTAGYTTGVALTNTNATQTLVISLFIQPDNQPHITETILLAPRAHAAFSLTSMYPYLAGTRGTIRFTAPTPDITLLGLRFSSANSFTSLGAFQ